MASSSAHTPPHFAQIRSAAALLARPPVPIITRNMDRRKVEKQILSAMRRTLPAGHENIATFTIGRGRFTNDQIASIAAAHGVGP